MALLERESSLGSLNGWLDQVAAGSGAVVLVSGEAGIGKTALLQQFAQDQRRPMRRATRVLWGGCEALFTPHPLAPLYDIARQAGGEFAQAIAAASQREAIFNLTMDHLSRGPVPTVVIFEDLHWADEATLDLIKYLGRRLQRLGVMLVLSYRDDEMGDRHPLRSVIGDLPAAALRRLPLAPLSATAVTALADTAGRSDVGLHAITGGNPFFVTEALAVAERVVPVTVRDAVIARLARLSEPARDIVNLASLVPGKTERWLLEKTLTHMAAGTTGAIEECLSVGMVALPDGALAFRHELARRAVEEHLPQPQRQDLHARILQTLQRQIGVEIPATRLVQHADHAGDSAAVLRYAPLAAERAAALSAHREAAAHYDTALRHAASLTDAARADLLERLSYERYLIEKIPEAIAAREAALTLHRRAGDQLKIGDNLRWLSRIAWYAGQKAAAQQYAAEAISTLEALGPGRELAFAYSNRAQLHMLTNEVEPTLHWGRQAIDLATWLGDTEILIHAFNNVGAARAVALDAQGFDDLEHSLALALELGLKEHVARAYANLAMTAIRLHDFSRADRYLAAGIAHCDEHELLPHRYLISARAATCLALGDWNRAVDEAEFVLADPYVAPISRIQALVILGLIRLRRGEPDAEGMLAEAMALAIPTGEVQRIGRVVAARAEAASLQGDLQAISGDIRAAYDLARQQSDPGMQAELGYWLWRCGGAPNLPAPDLPAGVVAPYALQIRENWRAAADAWAAIGCPYEQATALANSDRETDLRQALQILEQLGAVPMAAILRRKLRAGGIRGIARGAQERHKQNPHGLTTREIAVLGQLTEGRRNADIARRLFVSEKTVDHHVSSILGKLGVRSRGEAAAAAYRLGLVAEAAVLAAARK